MNINCVGAVKAEIYFDNGMAYLGMNDTCHHLQEYIDKAASIMTEYGFVTAQIVDCKTDEILVEIKE